MRAARIVAAALVVFAGASGGAGAQTPAPAVKAPVRANAVDQVQRATEIKAIAAQHVAALRSARPRAFKARSTIAVSPGHQDVQVSRVAGASAARSLDYCASHPPEIGRVSGELTPGGTLTITGMCFGSPGRARVAGQFDGGGFDLLIDSWSDTTVKAHVFLDSRGALDQPVELRLLQPRGTIRGIGASTFGESAPVRLFFVAARESMGASGYVDTLSCSAGDALEPFLPDWCGDAGWVTVNCELGKCLVGNHVRKTAGSGEDVYAVRLTHGFVLDEVIVLGDNADLTIDPSIDPSHVTFRIRWRTVRKSDQDAVKRGYPEYADYNDGSYLFYARITGPYGARP